SQHIHRSHQTGEGPNQVLVGHIHDWHNGSLRKDGLDRGQDPMPAEPEQFRISDEPIPQLSRNVVTNAVDLHPTIDHKVDYSTKHINLPFVILVSEQIASVQFRGPEIDSLRPRTD